jgi:hypothetical protein
MAHGSWLMGLTDRTDLMGSWVPGYLGSGALGLMDLTRQVRCDLKARGQGQFVEPVALHE